MNEKTTQSHSVFVGSVLLSCFAPLNGPHTSLTYISQYKTTNPVEQHKWPASVSYRDKALTGISAVCQRWEIVLTHGD